MPPHSQPTAKRHLDTPIAPSGKLAIAVHVYYPELWPEIAQRLKAIRHPFILDITTPPEQAARVEPAVKHDFPVARIHITPNRGMDILPFLSLVPHWQQEGILAVCKLHTKKGDGGQIATHWRKHLLDTLVGHPDTPSQIAQTFAEHPRLSLVGPATLYLSGQRLLCENEAALQQIHLALSQGTQGPLPLDDWGFFAGTMFWARPAALAPLVQLVIGSAAAITADYAKDGRYEHALERAFGLIPHHQGAQVGLIHPPASPVETPELQITEAVAPATRQLINPSHVSQAVHQTFSLVDWVPQRSKPRQADLVSIIIPIFNQPEFTAACVASLYQYTATERFELILVDNGSAEPTQVLLQSLASEHANIHLLRNAENLNFAHGCNLGFAASRGAIVVFLNNDTTVTPHWLSPLVAALQRSDIAAVQPKLLYPDGTIQCIGVVFSDKSPLGYPIYAGMQPEQHSWASRSCRFQAVTGACMALRAQDFAEMQGFDPLYSNGQEDIDLCLRLNNHYTKPAGWVAVESVVIHHESKTPNRFQHVAHNRRSFVRRWAGRVTADDQDYYAADGFSVSCYQEDSPRKLPAELQVFRAQIDATSRKRRPASADFSRPQCPLLSKHSTQSPIVPDHSIYI
jgi:GT2 family glycosyltransferase